jgi:hypothetical protein
MADQIVRKLGYDCGRFHLSASPVINIAHRAKKLDEVARNFITRHPDAVALDLGRAGCPDVPHRPAGHG